LVKKAVQFKASQLWDKLPVSLKNIVSIPAVKDKLKEPLCKRNDLR